MPVSFHNRDSRTVAETLRDVLVVDDIQVNRRLLALMLKSVFGIGSVREADDGESALREIDSAIPDLVLTDLWMPGMDGLALAKRIRGDARTEGVPIVVLTADINANAKVDCGVFDTILTKPVSMDEISSLLDTIAATHRKVQP